MKKVIYQAFKLAFGTVLAIFIAEILGLAYGTTAGIVTLLSILDSRQQTYIVGIKRIIGSLLALALIGLMFLVFGYNLVIFGAFLVVYIPLVTLVKLPEGISISAVLATHIYLVGEVSWSILFNEFGLVLIGIFVAWVLNLHVINLEDEIKSHQKKTEELIVLILHKMKSQLLNQCSISEQEANLDHLSEAITLGLEKAINFNLNHILSDHNYYVAYFKMRRQQYEVLKYMENHFRHLFISVEEAVLLSDFTEALADELDEHNDGMALLERLNGLKSHYRESALPKTRDEFENRATLFQYLNDLEYFIKLKAAFMVKNVL